MPPKVILKYGATNIHTSKNLQAAVGPPARAARPWLAYTALTARKRTEKCEYKYWKK